MHDPNWVANWEAHNMIVFKHLKLSGDKHVTQCEKQHSSSNGKTSDHTLLGLNHTSNQSISWSLLLCPRHERLQRSVCMAGGVSAVHYFWCTLLSPSWGMLRSSPQSTGLESHAKCLDPHPNPGKIWAAAPRHSPTPKDLFPTLFPTYSPAAHSQAMTCLCALWSRQSPPWQQLHSSVASTLMTTSVTEQEDNSGDRRNTSKPHACWAWTYQS